jgi:hypothetical protein
LYTTFRRTGLSCISRQACFDSLERRVYLYLHCLLPQIVAAQIMNFLTEADQLARVVSLRFDNPRLPFLNLLQDFIHQFQRYFDHAAIVTLFS